jgi:hypothetical protein
MSLPIVLYLRPFTSDGKVMVDNPEKNSIFRNMMPTSANGTESRVTIEELILQCAEGLGTLIAIGRTAEIIGAGKVIAGDDEWEDYFKALSLKARCIFSVPSIHPSTLWELEWLAAEKLASRVVMVMTELHFNEQDAQHFDVRTVVARLAPAGWAFPPDLAPGSLLTFQGSGAARVHVPKSKYKKKALRAMMQEVMARY